MNARTLSQFMLANITLVIDRQGQIRELTAGAQPAPGEVVMTVSDDANPQVQAQLIQANDQQTPLNIDDEVAQILAQLEQGVDPTLNPDQATAAGGANGSSPTDTGTIDMTLAEVLAQTAFDTHGLQDPGLSQTQSLAIDLVIAQALAPIDPVVNVVPLVEDESPVFVSTGDEGEGSETPQPVDDYEFFYNEMSSTDDVIGTVSAVDPEGEAVTYSIVTNVYGADDTEKAYPYFVIDNDGNIRLTTEGAAAFTNDYEAISNVHNLVVRATEVDEQGDGDVENYTDINVTLNEVDVDEVPVFVSTGDEGEGSETPQPVDDYEFFYNEMSSTDDIIGTVSAVDPEGESVTYSIVTNVYGADDTEKAYPYFVIDNDGNIRLTTEGAAAFTNDYEAISNVHNLVVRATEVDEQGDGDVENYTDINVTLNEVDVDEVPVFVSTGDEGEGSETPQPVDDYEFFYNEMSSTDDVIGTVSAVDPEGESVTYSIVTNVYGADDTEKAYPYFVIDNDGNIRLTTEGAAAFTNDYEAISNVHNLVVRATEVDEQGDGDVENYTDINVTLNEVDVDEVPVFVSTGDEGEGSETPQPVDDYEFFYNEMSSTDDVIGTVSAVDPEGESVTYSIVTNVYGADDTEKAYPYFVIDNDGNIRLTTEGAAAFTNDYEAISNVHNLVVRATEVDEQGDGDVENYTDINVTLNEININEAPVAEDFTVTVSDKTEVSIVFDTTVGADDDHISDAEVDSPLVTQDLYVVITDLPDLGELRYYTSETTFIVLDESYLYDINDDLGTVDSFKLLNPDNIKYVQDDNEEFHLSSNKWSLSDTNNNPCIIKLDNGAQITVSAWDVNGQSGNVVYPDLDYFQGVNDNQGTGIGTEGGGGMNVGETLHIDLSENPLTSINFILDGVNPAYVNAKPVTVTYELLNGTLDDNNGQGYGYFDEGEYIVSDTDNPVVGVYFTSAVSNYVLGDLTGEQLITSEDSFKYMAVDSELAMSEVATVTLDINQQVFPDQQGIVTAETGSETLYGNDEANIFTWLDSALDNSVDTVKNFTVGTDSIEIGSILTDESTGQDIAQLLANEDIVVSTGDNDVVLTVTHDAGEQSIVIENLDLTAYEVGGSFDAAAFLNDVLKTTDTTS